MQFASPLSSVETNPRSAAASPFSLVTGVNNMEAPSGWLQVPPTHMPWGTPASHQQSIVRFTAEPIDKPGPSGLNGSPFGQCKRKIETEMPFVRCAEGVHRPPFSSLPGSRGARGARRGVLVLDSLRHPTKQHITEEKMAAHMRQLHISNSYTSHEEPMMNSMNTARASKAEQSMVHAHPAPTVPAEDRAYKRLVLCEELRQLQQEPLLPVSLLTRMERPSMALVLWQPPAGKMGEPLSQALSAASESEEQQQHVNTVTFSPLSLDNNNTTGTIDLNTLHRFGQSTFSTDPDSQEMDM